MVKMSMLPLQRVNIGPSNRHTQTNGIRDSRMAVQPETQTLNALGCAARVPISRPRVQRALFPGPEKGDRGSAYETRIKQMLYVIHV